MIRSNETMTKAGLTEQAVLRRLAAADPENKKHVIRMIRAFDYRQHMCLVFEPMVGVGRVHFKKVLRQKTVKPQVEAKSG